MASLVESLSGINKTSFTNDDSRMQTLEAAKTLVHRLEEPWERVYDFVICHPTVLECLRTAQYLDLFSHLSPNTGKSNKELATATGADPALLQRILRVLVVWQYVNERNIDEYTATDHSTALADPNGLQGALDIFFHPERTASVNRLPDYFKAMKYVNPSSNKNAPWKWCIGKPDYPGDAWDWFLELGLAAPNANFLTGLRLELPAWPELYDISRLLDGWDEKTVLEVDVGGSKGKDVSDVARAIEAKFPEIARKIEGRRPEPSLIVQDRPETVNQGAADGTQHHLVDPMPHDFFKTNPVKGAKVYFMRQVLHDWPDPEAAQILSAIRESMTPGYSKVLLMEWVLPASVKETTEREAAMDVHMMMIHSACERNEAQWKSLFEKAGLKYVGYTPAHGHTSIIEAEL